MVQTISENGTLSKFFCSLEHSVCNPGLSETEVLYEFKSSKHEIACVAGVHFQNHVKGTKRETSHPRRACSLARLLDLSPRLGNGKEASATQVTYELELA